jgi:hypothetical protein
MVAVTMNQIETVKHTFYRPFEPTMLLDKAPLKPQKSLEFFIVENEFDDLTTDSDDPHENLQYEDYWKILNRREEAINRDQIGG